MKPGPRNLDVVITSIVSVTMGAGVFLAIDLSPRATHVTARIHRSTSIGTGSALAPYTCHFFSEGPLAEPKEVMMRRYLVRWPTVVVLLLAASGCATSEEWRT